MTKFIAVASGKGGVGSTTLAVNLGTALSSFSRNSMVFDADISSPSVGMHLGSASSPATVHDALMGRKGIREAVFMHPSGLKLAPGSVSYDDCSNADPKMLGKELKKLEGMNEFIIMDSAPGIGPASQAAIGSADEVIVAVTPDLPSVTSAIKTVKLAEKMGRAVVGAVVCMSHSDESEMDNSGIEAMLEVPVISRIPFDSQVREALKLQHPVVFSHPDSPASLEFKKLAAHLIGEEYKVITHSKSFVKSLFSFWGLE